MTVETTGGKSRPTLVPTAGNFTEQFLNKHMMLLLIVLLIMYIQKPSFSYSPNCVQ